MTTAATVYHVTIFGIHITVSPVAFTLPIGGGWSIYWYGILIAVGFLLALIYAFRNATRLGVRSDRLVDVILVTTPVAIIFARLYFYLFPYANQARMPFSQIINIHSGGLAVEGGLIAAFTVGPLMCKLRKVDVLSTMDLVAVGFPLAQAIGRWGNFVNQEAYGSATGSTWWGMTSERIVQDTGSAALVHPCFLYESVWCFLLFLFLHFWSKRRKFKGELFCLYLAGYGFARFFIEGLRTDSLMIGSLKVTQLLMAICFVAGLTLEIVFRARAKNRERDEGTYRPLYDMGPYGSEPPEADNPAGQKEPARPYEKAPDETDDPAPGDDPDKSDKTGPEK